MSSSTWPRKLPKLTTSHRCFEKVNDVVNAINDLLEEHTHWRETHDIETAQLIETKLIDWPTTKPNADDVSGVYGCVQLLYNVCKEYINVLERSNSEHAEHISEAVTAAIDHIEECLQYLQDDVEEAFEAMQIAAQEFAQV